MHTRFILLSLLSSIFFALPIYCQVSIQSLTKKVSGHLNNRPSELIYIQTSKGIYETGEDLWFKAYQLDAQTMELSDKSKTLYLQMRNSGDSVVWQEKYPIEKGVVSGHVYVDNKLLEGDYYLEGYTKDSFYKNDIIGKISARKIRVVKNVYHSTRGVETQTDSIFRFDVFPEGGNLVRGIKSKLAFKATDTKGMPVSIKGMIYQDDKPIDTIQSMHDGMGFATFVPLQGKNYKIELDNGKCYPLPDIQQEGIVLRLIGHDKEQLNFVVTQSKNLPTREIFLMGQMREMIGCIAKGLLKDSLKINIPLDNFPYQGIVEFTLFNGSMHPVAERLVYVHQENQLHIMAVPEKKNFITRKKANIKIRVTDKEGNPVKTNLGISVFDQAYNNLSDPLNILAYCNLSSQIRGKIYNPIYYFDEKNNNRMEALDLLLLTQGWRRYVWNTTNQISQGEAFLSDEITGTQIIKNKKKNKQVQGSKQLIQVSGAKENVFFVWTDSVGNFAVNSSIMKKLQGGYVYLKPMLSSEFKPTLALVDYFSQIDSVKSKFSYDYPTINLSDIKKDIALDLPIVSKDNSILLNEIMVTGKGQNIYRDKFMGHLDSLAQVNFGPYVCEGGYLENYLPGYTHHHNPEYCPCPMEPKKRDIPIRGKTYKICKYKYYDCPQGCCFSVENESTVVYEGPEYSEEELLRMNNLWQMKGYYTAREFYQPNEIDIQSSMPDARNTLLWAPSVVTDEKGEAEISFYCSDINTGFIGLIEGVGASGLLGTTKCEFRVIRQPGG